MIIRRSQPAFLDVSLWEKSFEGPKAGAITQAGLAAEPFPPGQCFRSVTWVHSKQTIAVVHYASAFGIEGEDRCPPFSVDRGGAGPPQLASQVSLLGQNQGVIDLDAEVADGALQL